MRIKKLLILSYFLLLTSYFLLPTSYFLLPTSYFLLPTSSLFAQGYKDTEDVWDDLHPAVSDADSVFISADKDSIFIYGVDTLWIFIPTEYTTGKIWVHGTVTGHNSKAAEIVFEMAAHTGDGTEMNSAEAESYQTMATTTATAGNTTAFSFWPMANSTLKASSCNYFTLRMRGTLADEISGMIIKVEYIYDKNYRSRW